MQEEMLEMSDVDLVGRQEEPIRGKEHGQEAMEEHTQLQQHHRLQEEPPASISPASWPPPLPAERERMQGLEDEGLGLQGLTAGKMPDVGLQQQQHKEELG